MNQNGKEPEGMDWLLAQLANAGGQEQRDPADDPYRDAEQDVSGRARHAEAVERGERPGRRGGEK